MVQLHCNPACLKLACLRCVLRVVRVPRQPLQPNLDFEYLWADIVLPTRQYSRKKELDLLSSDAMNDQDLDQNKLYLNFYSVNRSSRIRTGGVHGGDGISIFAVVLREETAVNC